MSDPAGFVVVCGRKPVLEALHDERVVVERLLVDRNARGDAVTEILDAARRRGVHAQRVSPEKVNRVSGNARHDQGVVAEVVAPGYRELGAWLSAVAMGAPLRLFVLDGVTNPSNVGMILRAAVAAGIDGVVVPEVGSPDIGTLVIKASAGVALDATVLRSPTAADAALVLRDHDVRVLGLRGSDDAASLYEIDVPDRAAFVLGNETAGLSSGVARAVDAWVGIPMRGGVESLNVATAAAVVAFELLRRSLAAGG